MQLFKKLKNKTETQKMQLFQKLKNKTESHKNPVIPKIKKQNWNPQKSSDSKN